MPWEKGQSGNPNGAPRRQNRASILAREKVKEAIKVLVDALADDKPEVRLKAASELLSRGYGKPQEYVELSTDPDEPFHISHSLTQKLLGMLPTEALQKLADESRNPPDNN